MGVLNVNSLKEGMVLLEDLFAPKGRFLMAGGTKILARHINIMKTWGVTEASVEGVSREDAAAEAAAAINPEIMRESEEYAQCFFCHANSMQPVMQELKRLSTLRAAHRLAAGQELPDLGSWGDTARPSSELTRQEPRISAGELVRRHVELVSFPDIYYRIVEVLNDPLSSATHLAAIVGKDPSLSAKLLKLVNSPFYGFPSKIESITRAISLIGANDLTNLALGISVVNRFRDIPPSVLDVRGFWIHSITCGVVARTLAGVKMGLTEERFFVAGLLHDIGRLVVIKGLGEEFLQAQECAREYGLPLHKAERYVIGYDHAMVAGLLMKGWRFPSSLERPIRFHHNPGGAINSLDSSILHVADVIAVAMQFGVGSSRLVPPMEENAWELLGISPSVLELIFSQTDRQVEEIEHMFIGKGGSHVA